MTKQFTYITEPYGFTKLDNATFTSYVKAGIRSGAYDATLDQNPDFGFVTGTIIGGHHCGAFWGGVPVVPFKPLETGKEETVSFVWRSEFERGEKRRSSCG